ncbi:MAG: T9SS type A sorting domain-containing protein [Bacteroidia bacterium]
MKILSTFIVALMVATGAGAQIILDENNYTHSATHLEVQIWVDPACVQPIEPGADKVWNFLSWVPSDTDTVQFIPATDPMFTTASRYELSFALIGGIPAFAQYYQGIGSDGFFETGSYVLPNKLNLEPITGSTDDTLAFPGSYSVFQEPVYRLKFPATHDDTWKSNFKYETDFVLTIPAMGIDHAPGVEVQHIEATDSVVGWGAIKIPTPTGSAEIDVLMVKSQRMRIDSFYFGGAPAPQMMLDMFGVAQADTHYVRAYYFYSTSHDGAVAEVFMDDEWQASTNANYQKTGFAAGISKKNGTGIQPISLFPNPARENFVLGFHKNNGSDWNITMYNSKGQLVKNKRTAGPAGEMQVDIARGNNLQSGLYFINVVNENGMVVAAGKVVLD